VKKDAFNTSETVTNFSCQALLLTFRLEHQ